MDLREIQGIGPATVKKLNSAGVRTLDDMRQMDVGQVADKTGLAEVRLREWKTEARLIKVLDDVKGIGPATKKKLQAAGIHNLEDMAKAAAHEVAHATSIAQERVKEWQKQARKLLSDAESYVDKQAPKVKAAATKAKETGTAVATQAKRTGDAVAHDVKERVEAFRDDTPEPTPGQNGRNGDGSKPTFVTRLKRLFAPKQS